MLMTAQGQFSHKTDDDLMIHKFRINKVRCVPCLGLGNQTIVLQLHSTAHLTDTITPNR